MRYIIGNIKDQLKSCPPYTCGEITHQSCFNSIVCNIIQISWLHNVMDQLVCIYSQFPFLLACISQTFVSFSCSHNAVEVYSPITSRTCLNIKLYIFSMKWAIQVKIAIIKILDLIFWLEQWDIFNRSEIWCNFRVLLFVSVNSLHTVVYTASENRKKQ